MGRWVERCKWLERDVLSEWLRRMGLVEKKRGSDGEGPENEWAYWVSGM